MNDSSRFQQTSRDPISFVFHVYFPPPLSLQLLPGSAREHRADPSELTPPLPFHLPGSALRHPLYLHLLSGSAREFRTDPSILVPPTYLHLLPGSARELRVDPGKFAPSTFPPTSPRLLPGSARELRADPSKLAPPTFSPVSPRFLPGSARELRVDPSKLTPPTFSPVFFRVCSRTSSRPEQTYINHLLSNSSPGLLVNIEQTRDTLHHPFSLQLLPGSARQHRTDPGHTRANLHHPLSLHLPGSARERRADPEQTYINHLLSSSSPGLLVNIEQTRGTLQKSLSLQFLLGSARELRTDPSKIESPTLSPVVVLFTEDGIRQDFTGPHGVRRVP
ncbi:hypothetical protein BYT27DRAFT_7249139 [Phlegmacium glaucopus]|nr:hypothetical protein BYT27DRAFT_7249139 [Phlegmacium glaucopus]